MSKQVNEEEAKHTPKPWNDPVKTGDGKRILIEVDGDGWHSLRVEVDSDDCDRDTAMANAHLICASPDLLDACKRSHAAFLWLIESLSEMEIDINTIPGAPDHCLLAPVLTAAIAKAEKGLSQ